MDAQGNKIRAISERLRQEILSGKFDGTGRFPSDRMLMRRFAVARATVQAAMKDLQSANLVDRKPGYGTFLTARASVAAARKFGVIVPDAFYPFYTRICRGIDEAARRSGWSTLSVALGTESMRERAMKALAFAEVCAREKVSGVFFQPLQFLKDGVRFNRAILDVFDRARIPVVLLDSDYLPLPRRSDYDLVGIDNVLAGYTLAQHVIAQGAKRIWYFSNPLPAPTSVNRGNGVALAVVGVPALRRDQVRVEIPGDGDPVAVGSICEAANVKILNDLDEAVAAEVVVEFRAFDGRILKRLATDVRLPPDSVTDWGGGTLRKDDVGEPSFLVLRLKTRQGEFRNDWMFGYYKEYDLARAKVMARFGGLDVTLSTDRPAFFVWANVRGVRGEFSDNSLTLLPDRPVTLTFKAKEPVSPEAFRRAFEVTHLRETY